MSERRRGTSVEEMGDDAVVLSQAEYESMQATIEVLSDEELTAMVDASLMDTHSVGLEEFAEAIGRPGSRPDSYEPWTSVALLHDMPGSRAEVTGGFAVTSYYADITRPHTPTPGLEVLRLEHTQQVVQLSWLVRLGEIMRDLLVPGGPSGLVIRWLEQRHLRLERHLRQEHEEREDLEELLRAEALMRRRMRQHLDELAAFYGPGSKAKKGRPLDARMVQAARRLEIAQSPRRPVIPGPQRKPEITRVPPSDDVPSQYSGHSRRPASDG